MKPVRLHRTTTNAVIHALDQIFGEGRYADKVIEKTLKQNSKWGARDRRFIAETTYDVVRWYLLLRIVARAKEDEYWKILGAWFVLNGDVLPPWDEFRGVKAGDIKSRYEEVKQTRRYRESIPDWLDELGARELGEHWDKELTALNEAASVVLRTNSLKISKRDLIGALQEEDVQVYTLDAYPEALVLEKRQNIFTLDAFKNGYFEVQDAA
ncbi:MAG TPA: hypothetical protein VKZ68_00455, partial [Ohtaekwangia sp.]|nr:hypothetical protein [Ohtaekwangia sp.]